MGFRTHDRKTFIADACRDFTERHITKRDFLRKTAHAGIGFSAFATTFLGKGRPFGALSSQRTNLAAAQSPPDVEKWLKEVGGKFKGTKIRYSTEAAPPSMVANQLVNDEFTRLTGIEVAVEITPLEQVLQKAMLDVQGQLGTYDLYYLDQSWIATFSQDTEDPQELYNRNEELAMPGFNSNDFSKPLVEGISIYKGKMVGIPFDIPIFILMYRKDLFDKHGLTVPTTMDEYMDAVKKIHAAESRNGIAGTTGQLKSGHYSLNCDWTCWLWSHGGSIFGQGRHVLWWRRAGPRGARLHAGARAPHATRGAGLGTGRDSRSLKGRPRC